MVYLDCLWLSAKGMTEVPENVYMFGNVVFSNFSLASQLRNVVIKASQHCRGGMGLAGHTVTTLYLFLCCSYITSVRSTKPSIKKSSHY